MFSSYIGNGRTAELIGQFSAAHRSEEEEKHRIIAEEIAAMKAEDLATNELLDMAVELMKAELTAEGFHQHDRGEWRKIRNAKG